MLNFEDAAAGIGDCVRAYTALHYQAQVCAGDTVLVLDGASSFGSVTVQLARRWGAKVYFICHNMGKSLDIFNEPFHLQIYKMDGIFCGFLEGDNISDFLFASLKDRALPKVINS